MSKLLLAFVFSALFIGCSAAVDEEGPLTDPQPVMEETKQKDYMKMSMEQGGRGGRGSIPGESGSK